MLPKKTFTMSYILKKAIFKPKIKEKPISHSKSIKYSKKPKLTTKKDHLLSSSEKRNDVSLGNVYASKPKFLQFSSILRYFGDIFLLTDEKNLIPLFEIMNEFKKIKKINLNKALSLYEFFIFEYKNEFESNEKGLNELRTVKSKYAYLLADFIEKYFTVDFEKNFTKQKVCENKPSFKSFLDEIFLFFNENIQNYMLMIHCELNLNGLQLNRISFNGNVMKLIHGVELENIENVVRNDLLPNCISFSLNSYYEFMEYIINFNQELEKKITLSIMTDEQINLKMHAVCKKNLFSNAEKKKIDICLFLTLEIDNQELKELEKTRKSNIIHLNLRENWTEFINRYYIQTDSIKKVDAMCENKRCSYKVI